MIQFVGRRLLFILFVCVAIIFFVYLGMGLVRNSEAAQPSYDLWEHGQAAWEQTRDFFSNALRGDFGEAYTKHGPVPVQDVLADTYVKSMALLAAALAVAAVIGLTAGVIAGFPPRSRLAFPCSPSPSWASPPPRSSPRSCCRWPRSASGSSSRCAWLT